MSVMLYKAPGKHKLHGFDVDYIIVDEGEVDGMVADGWSKTPAEAAGSPEEADDPAPAKRRGRPPKKADGK